MSFNSSSALESQPLPAYRDSDSPNQYTDDPEFERLTSSLSSKLSTLTNNINQLQRQVDLLGTRRETDRVRERVQDLIEETSVGFKDVGEGLKKCGTWTDLVPQQKYAQNKISTDFRSSLGEFQVLQRRALEKQRAARTALESDRTQTGISAQQPLIQAGGDQSQQQQRQVQQQEQQQQRLAPQSEVDFNSSLIVERESEIRQIEHSVGELNELFRDVATMVHDQGYMVDSIADNVESTREDTRGASQELRTANRYQKSARSKACCLLVVLAVVLIVVILASIFG